jgi:hypothetical protein
LERVLQGYRNSLRDHHGLGFHLGLHRLESLPLSECGGYRRDRLDFWTSLRYNVFQCRSSFTTTGFTNFPSLTPLGRSRGLQRHPSDGHRRWSWLDRRCASNNIVSPSCFKDFRYSIRYHFASDRQVNPNPVYRLGELKEEDSAASTEAHNYTLLYLVFFSSGR